MNSAPNLSSRGISLIAVLIATAMLGIIAVTIASLYDNIAGLMSKSLVANDADNLMKLVEGVMTQKELCSNAFEPAVTWDGVSLSTDIQRIHARSNPGGSNPIASVGQTIGGGDAGNRIRISRIYVQPAINPLTGATLPTPPTPRQYQKDGIVHTARVGTLTIEFEPTAAGSTGPASPNQAPLMGGILRPRYLNVSLGINGTTIDDCPGLVAQMKSVLCNATIMTAQGRATEYNNCVTRASALQARGGVTGCAPYFFVNGFDPDGVAICACDASCDRNPFTPTTAAPTTPTTTTPTTATPTTTTPTTATPTTAVPTTATPVDPAVPDAGPDVGYPCSWSVDCGY